MKKLLFLLLLLPTLCKANHVSGVDIYYKFISGNDYMVFMTIYGNCDQNNFSSLPQKSPQMYLVDSAQGLDNVIKSFTLSYMADSTKEVNPYCASQQSNTACATPVGLYPGYKRFIYSAVVTLPYKSSKWIFRFNTSMNPGACSGSLGRPTNCKNIPMIGGDAIPIGVEAMVDNTTSNNNSTTFDNSVFTAYCINNPAIYRQGAAEADGDSLVFALTPAMRDNMGSCNINIKAAYATGFTFNNPMDAAAGTFNFSTTTGNISFTPNIGGYSYGIATKIYEYRNGKIVGWVTREKEFNILSSCSNPPPTGNIDTSTASMSGGKWIGTNSIIICPDQTIQFKIPLTDANGDTIKASILSLPPGATATITGNNTKTPVINFLWNTQGTPPATFNFTCYYTDNGCPFPSSNQVTYTIEISDIGYMRGEVIAPTNCVHLAQVKYTYHAYQGRPYNLTVTKDGVVIKTYRDYSGVIYDSVTSGTYTVKVFDDLLPCFGTNTFTVSESGVYPYAPVTSDTPLVYCRNAVGIPALTAKLTARATSLAWYDENHKAITTTPVLPLTNVAGTFKYYVTQKYLGCESAADSLNVTITQDTCEYDIKVYNAFSPNGDGKNDVWTIHNIDEYPKALVQVFNKVGNKVFEQNGGYQNNWMGGELPSGVYYYLINLNEPNKATGLQTYTGFLMLQR